MYCRLCSDPTVATQVVELQGVNRLVRLFKEERERNHSDGVLVACLVCLLHFLTIVHLKYKCFSKDEHLNPQCMFHIMVKWKGKGQ
jgi:hypothetical protein